ncbi:NAD(P)H-dependent oxidoreductase [Cohaesibacter gelatinilyticus]|uniref:Putative NADPH-quinone reductase (Modulator of drug activity B) n=1 Tax=Cohaesibacter gelatinilyticus TaxID=372072 RepID=A0A285NAA0_9HYPH|nr:NAD(P)H-dependent oxidoreductase [Cohaesibacter gelatinilyticus]SNZ06248.1 Putative NADPH-quinone reductase (modulator of drug activity B) [Cohaesibacter gelatinilyticus]
MSGRPQILVVSCHPLKDSLNRHLVETVLAELTKSGANVTHRDLYDAGFDPRLQSHERESYYQGPFDGQALEDEITELTKADHLILIFPTWWFNLPAILKGWFDRVWAPGIAFDHASDLGPIKPRLTGLKSALIITTLGSPAWIDWFWMGRPVKRILQRSLFKVCAPQAKFSYLCLYKAEDASSARLDNFKRKISNTLGTLAP